MVNLRDTNIALLPIAPGTFVRGTETGHAHEQPAHIVELTTGFHIGRHLITQRQYIEVMNRNPSYFQGLENPVENVNWYDTMEFCSRLTVLQRTAGKISASAYFRLPTEAEWEFCCRTTPETAVARTGSAPGDDAVQAQPVYSCGDTPETLGEYAWYMGNSSETTHPVGEKKPNGRGLYDMHGNVSEWCHDWFGSYTGERLKDPGGPAEGDQKVRRGGSWASIAARCRATDRIGVVPSCACAIIGFRIVLTESGSPPYATDHHLW
ncbi:MAG: formylglycine-generating enzyme family protein [Candidatus Pacebacteria bacterium]|nr:formylglycine-generating enzyme family protein [Candidatus Paceibacterota bacterium]